MNHLFFPHQIVHKSRYENLLCRVKGGEKKHEANGLIELHCLQKNLSNLTLVGSKGLPMNGLLVGGFNPSEKYARQIGIFPK